MNAVVMFKPRETDQLVDGTAAMELTPAWYTYTWVLLTPKKNVL